MSDIETKRRRLKLKQVQARAKSQAPDHMAELSGLSQNLSVQPNATPESVPRENEWAGGVLPSPRQAVRNLSENLLGDNDPTTLNRGERAAAALNKGGESMTLGIVGDEAAGVADELIGRGNADERTQFYRNQEDQLWDQHPGLALSAEIGGALIGPVKGAGAFINAGKGTAARMTRAGLTGALSGGTYGALEGEGTGERFQDALKGARAGFVGGAVLSGLGQGFLKAKQALGKNPKLKDLTPALDELKGGADALYKRVYQSKVMFPKDQLETLANGMVARLRKEGLNKRLHGRVFAIFDELGDMVGKPQSLQQMEALRRIAGEVTKSNHASERRLGHIAKDMIDDAVANLGGATKELAEAREMWGRMRRVEAIENIIEKAADTKNFESSIQTGFRGLLRNPDKHLRGFSQEEIDAIRQVVRGGSLQRALERIGNRLSPESLTGMGVTGSAAYSGNIPLAAATATTGIAAKSTAKATTRKGAEQVRNLLARDPMQERLLQNILSQKNALAGPVGGMGGIVNALSERNVE